MNYLLIILIWTVYCFLHSYMISIRFTNLLKRVLKKYYMFYRLSYVIVSTVLLFPVFHYTGQLASAVIITYHPPWSIVRYILMIGSLLIFFKAFFFDYDALSFIGIRQMMELKKKPASHHAGIKKSGLLGVVRHPMYVAVIIYFWCQTFRWSDVVANMVLTAYIVIGTILEERKLVLEFGESYIQYKKEVPMLVPFLKIKNI
jgi:methanethiol S-methyltransferase